MKGKALLFKYLGRVDAVPLCMATNTADELIRLVKELEPSFGGIDLEDNAQPKCFSRARRLAGRDGYPRLARRPARDGDRSSRGS